MPGKEKVMVPLFTEDTILCLKDFIREFLGLETPLTNERVLKKLTYEN